MTINLASSEPSALRFNGVPLPRGLREDADAMSWSTFTATYAPNTGPLRLGHWECADADRRGPQPRDFRATLAIGDSITTAAATATGPMSALTAMLHDHGIAVEMLRFHQRESDEMTVTFIHGSDGCRAEWAMGLAQDPIDSALSAVIACANRLYPK